jgi:hypothetical protein
MRKFRIWDKKEKIMLYPHRHDIDIVYGKRKRTTYYNDYNGIVTGIVYYQENDALYLEAVGLRDKNGVDIYEGDFITIDDKECIIDSPAKLWQGEVIYDVYSCSYKIQLRKFDWDFFDYVMYSGLQEYWEIKGNKYQNT